MAKRKQKNETVAEKVDHTEIETKTAAAAQVESGAEETVTEALEAEKTVDAAEGEKNAEAEPSEAIAEAEVEVEAAETEPEPDLTEQLELARQEAA